MGYPPLPLTPFKSYKLQVFGELFGQTTINTLYYLDPNLAADPAGTAELEQQAADIWTVIDAPWLACVTSDWSLTKLVMESLDNRTQRPAILTYTPGVIVGTHAGDADTPWVAAKLLRITNVRGLRGQGCIRISGIPTSEIVGNSVSSALKTLVNALGTALLVEVTNTANPAFKTRLAQVHHTPTTPPVNRGEFIVETEAMSPFSSQRTRRARPTV